MDYYHMGVWLLTDIHASKSSGWRGKGFYTSVACGIIMC